MAANIVFEGYYKKVTLRWRDGRFPRPSTCEAISKNFLTTSAAGSPRRTPKRIVRFPWGATGAPSSKGFIDGSRFPLKKKIPYGGTVLQRLGVGQKSRRLVAFDVIIRRLKKKRLDSGEKVSPQSRAIRPGIGACRLRSPPGREKGGWKRAGLYDVRWSWSIQSPIRGRYLSRASKSCLRTSKAFELFIPPTFVRIPHPEAIGPAGYPAGPLLLQHSGRRCATGQGRLNRHCFVERCNFWPDRRKNNLRMMQGARFSSPRSDGCSAYHALNIHESLRSPFEGSISFFLRITARACRQKLEVAWMTSGPSDIATRQFRRRRSLVVKAQARKAAGELVSQADE